MAIRGIDVSRWQGSINWNLVKDNGVEYAIIKAGGADKVAGAFDIVAFSKNLLQTEDTE